MSARVSLSTLTPDSAGFRSRALRRATLSVTSPERVGGAVRLEPAIGDAQLELVAEGAAPVAGELASGAVIYRDAFPDTDVVHAAHGSRFEELRVLHSPKAPTTARYRLKSAGTLRANRGTIEVVDAQGRVQLRSLPAYAIDAAGKRRALDVQLDTSGSEPVMIAKLDTAGLSYPITVDPTWVSGGAGAWPSEALVALNSIWIEGGVTTTGSAAVIDAAPGAVLADSAELVVGLGATLTGTAKANRVRVRLGGTIAGDVFTNALTNNGTVTGTTHTPLALPLALTVPDQPSVSPGSADVTLAPHQDLTLAAGAYRNASLGLGTTADPTVLTLSGGVYHFASLDLGAASRLECSQPCDVRVQGKLGPGLGSFIGPAAGSGLAPADVQLFVAGLNGLTGTLGALPKAAAIGVGSTLHARVHVPNGTLWVRAGTAVTGTLIAKDLQLGLGASVTKDATGTCGPTDDGNPCTADSCDTATGTVHHDPVPAGTGCDDATVCNGHESCDGAGTCQAGTPIAVDDGNECTADSCDPQAGAQHAPLTGTACDDESACTQTDTCQAGTCTGTNPVSCAPLDQCHDAGTCNPTTGACTNPPKADGIACNDGSACTQTDACQAGTCTGTNPVGCAPLDQCHDAGICNPTTGACTNPAKADGASCDDENPCTTGEACSAGSCGGGSPTPVSDGNPCTADACSPTGGVTHTPVTAGTPCSDADLCNGDEICNASGTCQPGTPVATSDGNPCTLDQCNPLTGSVTHPAAPAGTPCNADACTIGALCDAGGACQGGTPVLVDDGDPCTVDTCDPITGPAFTTCSTVDRTVSTHISGSLAWLYTGANPVQTGVAPGTITVARAAALRGEVRDRAGNPLPGVTVRIEGRPELGQTTTHSNGGFDMVVNGGGELRLVLQKSGFLPVERTVPVAWGEHASVPPVVMTKLDAAVTPVSFAGAPSMQVARGTAQTDANGSRQATLLIAGGTTAALIASDGTPTPVTALHLRATEYTVGAAGPKAMPAPLPPTSQYTYAVELSADEAIAVGAARVELSQPAVFYVDNFLALPAGETVPVGAYDRALGKWVAEQSGVVLRVLSVSGGVAAVDATGDGLADTPTELAARGITSDELATLGQLYVTGQSVWRVSLAHFTPIDCNFPAKPPSAPPPPQPKWPTDDNDDSCLAQGSKLECENQILQEEVPLAGTPYHLVYSSDRTPGRLSSSTVPIVLSGATVPSDLKRIDVEIVVAGQVTRQSFPPLPNQTHVYQWDGRDGFGRLVQGRQHATVTLDWVFDVAYEKGSTFGDYGTGVTLDYNAARAEISARRVFGGPIGPWDAKPMGLGGWTLSEHHAYDPVGGVLYMGDGSRRSAAAVPAVLEKVVDLAASSPWLGQLLASDAVAEADGGMFVADESQSVVWRISATGSATVYAGTLNQGGHSGDGGPATSAVLNRPHKLALAPDGSLFIVDTSSYVVRKVSSGGMISTVAGIPNQPGFTGDGGLATSAKLQPVAVAIGPDGLLYIGESRGIRRVGADGIIRTIAGNGSTCCTVDEVPATSSALNVSDLAFGPTGSLYVADAANYQLRWIDGAGIIHSLGGTACPVASCDGEDGTPLQASGGITPSAVQPLADGTVLFVDRRSPMRLRAVAPDGILHSLAGGGASAFAQGLPARQAALILNEVALASDGRVLLPLHNYQPRVVVLRVNPPLPGLTGNGLAVASGQGSEVYVFDASGRHLSTRDTRTGATRMSFAYSSAGRLVSLTDANGNITTIQHDAGGNPTAIVGPYGHQTVLGVDANGFLTTITDPLAATVTSSYTPAGLMTAFTDARSHTSTMTYDALGRVSTDANAASGSVSFLRTTGFDAFTVNKSTALGRTTTYDVDFLTTGGALRTNTFPDGTVSTLLRALDGQEVVTAADGTIYSRTDAPDPRLGLQAPVTSRTTRTPGGLLRTETVTRTVTGAVPADPLAFTQQTDTVDVNGRPTTTVFDKATLKTTVTSAQGRVTKTFHDTQMRVTRREITGITPVDFLYDARGRLSTVTQGPRVRSTGYYSTSDGRNGYVQSVTNALSQTTAFTPDAVGRILQQLDPDSALTAF
ncbi:MAG: carboxypeptidase regulatory-like domain-containing protein, partial [Polyangiaceae bacterium]|nr:carboxypeptidase regulatory-like domain-containing protein [Polyangiaceae bacterium]